MISSNQHAPVALPSPASDNLISAYKEKKNAFHSDPNIGGIASLIFNYLNYRY